MGKYANNCVTMFLKQSNPPGTVTGNHMMMQGTPKGVEKLIHIGPDGNKGGPYPKYHRKADNMMFFYGTDPNNLNDLGAHVEFHLGEGEDEEVFGFDEPRCIFIPKGVRHGPLYVTNFHRNFIIFDILSAPTRIDAGTETDFSYVAEEKTTKLP
jgi:hypothetical protein